MYSFLFIIINGVEYRNMILAFFIYNKKKKNHLRRVNKLLLFAILIKKYAGTHGSIMYTYSLYIF